jgi:hypothetical protein
MCSLFWAQKDRKKCTHDSIDSIKIYKTNRLCRIIKISLTYTLEFSRKYIHIYFGDHTELFEHDACRRNK